MKLIITMLLGIAASVQVDSLHMEVKDGVQILKSGVQYSLRTFTEIYEVLTDSLVYRFGMEYRISDSTFIRRRPMSGYSRKLYDEMQSETKRILEKQEEIREQTIEFINRNRASSEVWMYFQTLDILK